VRNGGTAVSISAILGIEQMPDREAVIAIAAEVGADGVLVTRLKSVDKDSFRDAQQTKMKVDRGGLHLDGYRAYDYWESTESAEYRTVATVVIASTLYDSQSGEQIWGIDSVSFDHDSIVPLMHDNGDVIGKQLKKTESFKLIRNIVEP
jgi:hypothetical protein